MATDRSRANRSLGNRINDVNGRLRGVENNSSDPTISDGFITSDHLGIESVDELAIAPGAVTADKIARGAVGTNQLGVVNQIVTDNDLTISTGPDGYVALEGDNYPLPEAGSTSLLGFDETGRVILSGAGSQGPQGPQGAAGTNGTNGTQGAQGPQGAQGAASTVAGPQGSQGPQGAQGAEGPVGGSGMAAMPAGAIVSWPASTAPAGWLLCNGGSYSATDPDYVDLYEQLVTVKGTFAATIASNVITFTAHGLNIGDRIYMTSTGTLPTGITAYTNYYVRSTSFTVNAFTISASPPNATTGAEGAVVTLSGTPTGNMTITSAPYGAGNGTFNVPDLRGRVIMGVDNDALRNPNNTRLGNVGGGASNTHQHFTMVSNDGTNTYITQSGTTVSGSTPGSRVITVGRAQLGGGTASGGTRQDATYDATIDIRDPYQAANYIIKYIVADGL